MKYGYAVRDNDLSMQLKALREFGCDEVKFGDELNDVIKGLENGDFLVVWRLDKLSKSVDQLEKIIKAVHDSGASVELLFEQLNSGSDYKEILSQLIDIMKDIEKL